MRERGEDTHRDLVRDGLLERLREEDADLPLRSRLRERWRDGERDTEGERERRCGEEDWFLPSGLREVGLRDRLGLAPPLLSLLTLPPRPSLSLLPRGERGEPLLDLDPIPAVAALTGRGGK